VTKNPEKVAHVRKKKYYLLMTTTSQFTLAQASDSIGAQKSSFGKHVLVSERTPSRYSLVTFSSSERQSFWLDLPVGGAAHNALGVLESLSVIQCVKRGIPGAQSPSLSRLTRRVEPRSDFFVVPSDYTESRAMNAC
jgi:hypothetical protein